LYRIKPAKQERSEYITSGSSSDSQEDLEASSAARFGEPAVKEAAVAMPREQLLLLSPARDRGLAEEATPPSEEEPEDVAEASSAASSVESGEVAATPEAEAETL
jgi:hypothetical protein